MRYFFISIAFTLFACSNLKKETETVAFDLSKSENKIQFTAYKTTKKVPVKGVFNAVDILSGGRGKTIKGAVNNTEFKIPVSSIETNNSSRNAKIIGFFFDVMDSDNLKGKIHIINETNGYVDFTMNGITEKLDFTYSIKDSIFEMKAIMDLSKWKAQKAISSLNSACEGLHAGDDGISKTWEEVAIAINCKF